MNVVIITASDRCFRQEAEDTSGPEIAARCRAQGWDLLRQVLLPDDRTRLAAAIRRAADELHADLVLTTGGTGLGPRDVTPEATLDVATRRAPGIAEYLRQESLKHTPFAALSRGEAALRGRCLVVNLPGSLKAVKECMDLLIPLLPHAVAIAAGGAH